MTKTPISASIVSVLLAVTVTPAEALPQGAAIDLAPHRAIYEMSLRDATAGSNISDVRGRLVFDFEGSTCAGYTLESRLVTQVVDREGNSTLSDLRSSTWEDAEGDRFRFDNSQYIGRQLSEQVIGNAERGEKTNEIAVKLKEPAKRELTFDGGALFPTQHSVEIIKAAKRGEKVLQADIYDGSEQGVKLFKTTTFIGKPTLPEAREGAGPAENKARLNQLTSWPVSISYYEAAQMPASDEGVPTYELSFRLFANGVSGDLLINYGNFLVHGTLSQIDFHEPAKCP